MPMYIIEESKVVPYIKPRFYSIVNDPFPNGADTTKRLEFAFSLTKFEKYNQERLGLCTQFLTDERNLNNEKVEIKSQFSQVYRILRMPTFTPADAGKTQHIIMIAHGTGIAPFISMLQRIQNDAELFERV